MKKYVPPIILKLLLTDTLGAAAARREAVN